MNLTYVDVLNFSAKKFVFSRFNLKQDLSRTHCLILKF